MLKVKQVITEKDVTAFQLKKKVLDHTAVVGVIGLGYVGLPLAVEKGKVGFSVLGFELDHEKVAKVNAGQNYIGDVKDEELKDLAKRGMIKATTDFSLMSKCDVIIICVPTPLTVTRDPDTSYMEAASNEIVKYMRPGQIITLESTTYPGTTQDVILPILEKSGLTAGKDFFLAFSPERVDPGNKRFSTKNTSKVVGGLTPICLEIAVTLYEQTIVNVVPVSSPAAAELTKVFENTYRAVNIALVNEMMLLCDRMGIDVWEVVEAASTKPFGIHTFYPGPGVGGHCIPIDPFYLTWKAREYDFHTRFIELAGEINVEVTEYVVSRVARALNEIERSIKGAKILILGVAYKKDIEDMRESPALNIIELLRKEGAKLSYYDPFVSRIEPHGGSTQHMESIKLTDEALTSADVVLIITDHSDVDYNRVVEKARLVVDTRNATRDVEIMREKIVKI
ncbi:MAG: nucleotide sugar dehydrogenase [Eubacteriales bacterium]